MSNKLFSIGEPKIDESGNIIMDAGESVFYASSARDLYDFLKRENDKQKKIVGKFGWQRWQKFPTFEEMDIVEVDIKNARSISATCGEDHL
jgi:hypothetical protein